MPTRRYAEGTDVPEDRSRAEIERTLRKHGASQFIAGWQEDAQPPAVMVQFRLDARFYRVVLPIKPRPLTNPYGRFAEQERRRLLDSERRRVWRVLLLLLKSNLELAQNDVLPLDELLLPYVLLPEGLTAGEWLRPQIQAAYEAGTMPALLPAPRTGG